MPDGSGNVINGELVVRQNIQGAINIKVNDWLNGVLTWYGSAVPANFPSSMLEATPFDSMSGGDLPSTNPDGYIDHDDIGPVINAFCDKYTLLRKTQFDSYQDQRPTGSGTPSYVLISTTMGYARFLDNPPSPGASYTITSSSITERSVSGDFEANDIDAGAEIKSGTPYSANGFNDFIDEIESQLNVNKEDLVLIEYFYCHSQCHSNCYAKCSHSFSDKRLKKDIEVIREYLPGIPHVKFKWKKDQFSSEYIEGVIAQDVLAVYPELVTTSPDGMLMVNYDKLEKKRAKYNERLSNYSA